jgi:hypothetical protein
MTAASSALVNRLSYSEVATHDAAAPGVGATWTHLPALGTPRGDLQQEYDDVNQTNMRGNKVATRPTRKSGKISLDLPFLTATLGLDGAGGDTAPTSCYLQKALESAFGGVANNNGSGTQANFAGSTISGGTTAAPTLTSATNIRVGDFLAFDTTFQVRQVTAISGSTVTLDRVISSAAPGVVVYGFFNFRVYKDGDTGASAKHLYVNHEMDGIADLFGPGRPALSFESLTAGAGLRVKMAFDGNTWAAGLTPTSLPDTVYTGAELVGVGATLAINGTEDQANLKALTLGIQYAWHSATTGAEGRDGLRIVGQLDPMLTLSRLYASADKDAHADGTAVPIVGNISVGSTAGAKARGTFAFAMPNAQRVLKRGMDDQMNTSDLSFSGRDPTEAQRTAGLNNSLYIGIAGGVA